MRGKQKKTGHENNVSGWHGECGIKRNAKDKVDVQPRVNWSSNETRKQPPPYQLYTNPQKKFQLVSAGSRRVADWKTHLSHSAHYLWLQDIGKVVLEAKKVYRDCVLPGMILENRGQKALRST